MNDGVEMTCSPGGKRKVAAMGIATIATIGAVIATAVGLAMNQLPVCWIDHNCTKPNNEKVQ